MLTTEDLYNAIATNNLDEVKSLIFHGRLFHLLNILGCVTQISVKPKSRFIQVALSKVTGD